MSRSLVGEDGCEPAPGSSIEELLAAFQFRSLLSRVAPPGGITVVWAAPEFNPNPAARDHAKQIITIAIDGLAGAA